MGKIPHPDFISRKHSDDPEMMLRSKCLDFQWSSFFVDAEYNNGENETRSVRLLMTKKNKKAVWVSVNTHAEKITTCVSTSWEILLNDQWFTVSFNFPTAQRQTSTGTFQATISRSKSLVFVNDQYRFSKPDFCQQV